MYSLTFEQSENGVTVKYRRSVFEYSFFFGQGFDFKTVNLKQVASWIGDKTIPQVKSVYRAYTESNYTVGDWVLHISEEGIISLSNSATNQSRIIDENIEIDLSKLNEVYMAELYDSRP